jgi:hypothetical protein
MSVAVRHANSHFKQPKNRQHCGPLGRAKRRPMKGSAKQTLCSPAVIASEAKQSIGQQARKLDCFAALAMTKRHNFAISPHVSREACQKSPPSRIRGRAGCRVPSAPAASYAHIGSEYAYEYSQRSHRNHPASRTQWFTAYIVLSPVIGFLATVADGNDFHQLDASTEASGPHVFAVRVSAVRQRHIHVHRIPPRVRDDREPPLMWDETAMNIELICVFGKPEYFFERGFTDF